MLTNFTCPYCNKGYTKKELFELYVDENIPPVNPHFKCIHCSQFFPKHINKKLFIWSLNWQSSHNPVLPCTLYI